MTDDAVEEIAARLAIADVLHRYARGIDRLDFALVRACYHLDALDERPPLYAGPVEGFLAWVEPVLAGMVHTTHAISNVLVVRDGDEAGVESYWQATLRTRTRDGLVDLVRAGRYLDRFSRRGGLWAIAHRRAVTDWSRSVPVADAAAEALAGAGVACADAPLMPRRDRGDPSYAVLDVGAPKPRLAAAP